MKRILSVCFCLAIVTIILAITACSSSPTTKVSPTPSKTTQTSNPVTTTKPAAEAPKYGGEFTGVQSADYRTFDITSDLFAGQTRNLTNERIIDGDWAKGPAGGYGTSEALWDGFINIPTFKEPRLAEQYSYTVDANTKSVTGHITVRQGVHYALDSNSAASRLVNGREVTADDIVYNLDQRFNDPKTMFYQTTPACQGLHATKISEWEVSFTIPIQDAVSNLMKLIDNSLIVPREVMDKYGDMSDWRNSVGTGPFILTDYVSNSSSTLVKNSNYWMKDPIGPGKGNKLPYLDTVKWLIITDKSTRLAAIRTAKIDCIDALTPEDAEEMSKVPGLKQATLQPMSADVLYMRTDKEPFSDLRVRQALFLSINWQSMNESLYGGKAQIITFPYVHVKGYDDIYMDYNAPDIPADVKDLFSYHPDKAKQLLSEAGYPNGFKATVLTASNDLNVDYYSIIKEFWSKINVDLNISTMEGTALFSLVLTRNYESMITDGQSPPSTYPEQYQYTGDSWVNQSYIKDNKVTADANIARDLYLAGDTAGAMKATRELLPYVINQCWVLGPLRYPAYVFWWPWVKNYDGEVCVGYVSNYNFPTWIWVDQNLKQTMGH